MYVDWVLKALNLFLPVKSFEEMLRNKLNLWERRSQLDVLNHNGSLTFTNFLPVLSGFRVNKGLLGFGLMTWQKEPLEVMNCS